MTLLTLVIALLLDRYFHRNASLDRNKYCNPNWFQTYRIKIESGLKEQSWFKGWLSEAIIILLPAVVVYLAFAWYQQDIWYHSGFFGSIIMLSLSIFILFYCLGPESPRKSLDAYYQSRAEHNDQAAFENARLFTEQENAESMEDIDKQVARAIFRHTQTRYFGVVIWFLILGPAGALLYRFSGWYGKQFIECVNQQKNAETSAITEDDQNDETSELPVSDDAESSAFASGLHSVLEWIPARISVLLYLLAGDMSTGVSKIKKAVFDFDVAGLDLVMDAGQSSLGFYDTDDARGQSRCAIRLTERAGIILFGIVAIFSLLGWGYS